MFLRALRGYAGETQQLAFRTNEAKQSSPRNPKQHFSRCLAANNHKKGSIVTKHELGGPPHCHVIERGDHVRVPDVLVDPQLVALGIVVVSIDN